MPLNWIFKIILTHSYSNCPTRLKCAPFFRMPPKTYDLHLNVIYFYPQCFINTPKFKVITPKLRSLATNQKIIL